MGPKHLITRYLDVHGNMFGPDISKPKVFGKTRVVGKPLRIQVYPRIEGFYPSNTQHPTLATVESEGKVWGLKP